MQYLKFRSALKFYIRLLELKKPEAGVMFIKASSEFQKFVFQLAKKRKLKNGRGLI